MRQFEFEGNTYTLTEGQYYKLLNRFDEGFAKAFPRLVAEGHIIEKPCICDEFYCCGGCPLSRGLSGSCDEVLAHVMGIDTLTVHVVFRLGAGAISWQPHQDVCARRLVRKVYKALRRLPYVEEESVK